MFLCNKSLLNRAERVFVDVDIKPVAPGKPFETWGAKHNLRTSIDRLLMEELRTKYGAAKVKGIRVDKATHALLFPAVLPYCVKEILKMGALHEYYNGYVLEKVTRVIDGLTRSFDQGSKKKERIENKIDLRRIENKIDFLMYNYLQLSDMHMDSGELKVSRLEKPRFPLDEPKEIVAVPDYVAIVENKATFVLVAEDKAGTRNSTEGLIAQIFGESQCSTHNTRRKEVLRVVRRYNHYMTFFTRVQQRSKSTPCVTTSSCLQDSRI